MTNVKNDSDRIIVLNLRSILVLYIDCSNIYPELYRFVQDGQNPDQSPYDNLPAAAATYAVGGMATHWTAAIPREHPTIERSSLLTHDEWTKYYEESEKLLKLSHTLFEDSIRNTVVKNVLKETYPTLTRNNKYPPQNLPLAGERRAEDKEFVTWSGSNTVLGEKLVDMIKKGDDLIKKGDCPKIQLKVSIATLVISNIYPIIVTKH